MRHIIFEYKDKYTHGEWSTQECYVESLKQCIDMYGLDKDSDCEYRIIKNEEVK